MASLEILTADEMRSDLLGKAENAEFRARLLADPGAVIEAEYGIPIPEGFSVDIHEESANAYHVVLPASEQLSQDEMEAIAAGHPGHTGVGPCG